ncbi:MAG: TolC family protein [Candidatus Aminicenantes bacterium]|nr:TolC family protein [Candidatus Aminicenantes bacterium]
MDNTARRRRPAAIRVLAGLLLFGASVGLMPAGPAPLWAAAQNGTRADAQASVPDGAMNLETAIRLALANNERAIKADQNMLVADARLAKAKAVFLPQLSVSGSYTRRPFEVARLIGNQNIIVQSYNGLSGAANLSMTLFDSKSLPALLGANADLETEGYNTADGKRNLAFEVGTSFLGTLSQDQVLEASRRRMEYAKQSLDAARARFSAGLVSANDVTRAELEFATAEMGVTQVQGQVDSSYLGLGYLMNAPAPSKLTVPDFLLKAVDESIAPVDQLIAQAQTRRSDVLALRSKSRSQHALTIEPSLRWLPTLTLNGRYSYTNEAGLTGKNFNWNAGLSMSWSVFDGLTRNGEFSERKALAFQADLDVQAGLRKVDLDVRSAIVSLESQRAGLKKAAVAHDIAVRNAAETAELYRQGLSSALQVADANVRLFEATVDLVRARYGLGLTYLNLESALGLDPLGKEPNLEY